MSIHDDLFEGSGLPVLLQTHGQSVVYTPAGGAAVTRTMIVSHNEDSILESPDGYAERRVVSVTMQDGATIGVAAPAIGDKITFDGEDWFVSEVTNRPGAGINIVEARLTERQETSRSDYRLRR